MNGRRRVLGVVIAAATLVPAGAAGAADTDGEAGSAGLGDPYYPELGNGGYDVEHYDVDVRYHPRSSDIEATATITATATTDLAAFNLDLVGLTVDSVLVDGVEAAVTRTDTDVTVTPPAGITEGQEFTVEVRYHGTPTTAEGTPDPSSPGWFRTDNGATYVMAEPDGARTWFPANDHPSDKATYTFDITVPDGVEAAANGSLVSSELGDDGWRTWTWEMQQPMATYLATVVIGDYQIQETTSPDGITIRNFFLPSEYDAAVSDFARTGEMLDYFAELFGPYPFDEYGAVTVPELLGNALETQTLSVFGSDVVNGSGSSDTMISHELAHQWFGNSVTPSTWRDIWLTEGFASYAEALWKEHADPDYDIDAELADEREQLAAQLGPIDDPGADNLFNMSVYKRGALTLHALRRTIGDDAFFDTLRTWNDEYRHQNATTDDFIDVAERISGSDLTDFFDTWLTAPDIPELPA